MLKLTNRLYKVAQSVPKCNIAADIGTDHAYIPIYLMQNGIAKSVIATDVVKGPAKRAQNNINSYGLEDKISVKITDGLKGIDYADVIIIAGMGGKLICDILSDSPNAAKSANYLILQPMTMVYEVRRFLHENGYEIISEDLAKEEEKIYNILLVKKGLQKFDNDILYHIGKDLLDKKHELLCEYIKKKVHSLKVATDNMANSDDTETVSKRSELLELKKQFEKVGELIEKGM